MRREITYHCEGPDCESHQTSAARRAPIATWLLVIEGRGTEPAEQHDYCSWDCVLRAAAARPPSEDVDVSEVVR